MYEKYTVEERCQIILEDNGGKIADKARKILLEDAALKDLRPPLEFISKNWRDPLTPALMSLSCKAVGGQSERTYDAALAMSMMNLSVYLWDDIIDRASMKLFKPTLFGKFGEGAALIVGGLATAKAFSILNQMEEDKAKLQTITELFWDLWTKVAQAETIDLRLRTQKKLTSRNKLWKITTEASDVETCLKIGAIIGNGSEEEVRHLGRYGLCVGIILELRKDFQVSVNLTLELTEKIRNGLLPYSLLWAMEHSEKLLKKIEDYSSMKTIKRADIKELVEDILETKTLDNTLKTIRRFSKKAKEELGELEKNNATQTLQVFIEDQPSLFTNSLPTLQAYEG
jgi:geranylgeranyl diphosphate synthase type I